MFNCVRSPILSQILTKIAFLPRRNLNVHEHVSYTLLKEAGLPVPKFGVAKKVEDVDKIIKDLKIKDIVLKAQVLSGGRGKGTFKNGLKGGVQMVKSSQEAVEKAKKMIGEVLVTKQTGLKGIKADTVMVTEQKKAEKEYYMCILMERAFNGPVLMVSAEGGVEIEEVAKNNPRAISYIPIDISKGVSSKEIDEAVKALGLMKDKDAISRYIKNMYKLFTTKDATMVEINPLIRDKEGKFYCLDAKLRFDDSAFFRQKELFSLRDHSQEDPKEVEADKYGLNYIALDGRIGCMVNGAGLAMATCDIIKLYHGSPANFLDVGGGSDEDAVNHAFRIILMDDQVKGIFVNIFGGIMRCDIIANGITKAAKEVKVKVPVVVRLQGTNVKEGRDILEKSHVKLVAIDDFDEAAKKIVELAGPS